MSWAAACGLWAATAHAQVADLVGDASRSLVRLEVSRFGGTPACGVGFSSPVEGLILTTYSAIRGADQVRVAAPATAPGTGRVRVAGYSTSADVAALVVDGLSLPGLAAATDPPLPDATRAWGYTPEGAVVSVPIRLSGGGSTQAIEGTLPDCALGGPIVDQAGRFAALVGAGGMAPPMAAVVPVLMEAETNLAAGRLLAVRDVGSRERHLFGSAVVEGDAAPGRVARITPLEAWQWAEASAEEPLPVSFAGPMGRYSVTLLAQQEVVARETFEIRPGVGIRVKLTVGQIAAAGSKKSKPWLLGAVGAAGAGAAAFLIGALGGDEGGSPPVENGAIAVRVPRWHP